MARALFSLHAILLAAICLASVVVPTSARASQQQQRQLQQPQGPQQQQSQSYAAPSLLSSHAGLSSHAALDMDLGHFQQPEQLVSQQYPLQLLQDEEMAVDQGMESLHHIVPKIQPETVSLYSKSPAARPQSKSPAARARPPTTRSHGTTTATRLFGRNASSIEELEENPKYTYANVERRRQRDQKAAASLDGGSFDLSRMMAPVLVPGQQGAGTGASSSSSQKQDPRLMQLGRGRDEASLGRFGRFGGKREMGTGSGLGSHTGLDTQPPMGDRTDDGPFRGLLSKDRRDVNPRPQHVYRTQEGRARAGQAAGTGRGQAGAEQMDQQSTVDDGSESWTDTVTNWASASVGWLGGLVSSEAPAPAPVVKRSRRNVVDDEMRP